MLDKLREAFALAERLTVAKVLLWAAAVLAGIALWTLWEDRATRVPQLLQSTMVMAFVSASAVLALFGTVGAALFSRVEAKNAELQDFMRSQMLDMRQSIEALEKREDECRTDLRAVRIRMTRAEDTIRRAGLDFKSTE